MALTGLELISADIKELETVRPVGRVIRNDAGVLKVAGLSNDARLGDLVDIQGIESLVRGEVLALDPESVTILVDGSDDKIKIGARVILNGPDGIAPDTSWLGRVIDPFGVPFDDATIMRGGQSYSIRGSSLNPTERRGFGARLDTGMSVFNTMLPIVRGQRLGMFAGSGVGKTMLLARFAIGLAADVTVIALIGERGRELREFVEKVLGPTGMARTIVVAATSDMSALARRRCAWTAMAIAEYFRDRGRQVLFLADSITRFAEAHREIALSTGEVGSLHGFPPSTTQLITNLCERAGPGTAATGDITAVFSVLVAGSDMEGPIADILRGVLDGHVVLDREIAERGRFPAIDVLRSVSRSLPEAASEDENKLIGNARKLLGAYERAEMMIQAGLYAEGSDPLIDAAIIAYPKLDHLISKRCYGGIEESFAELEYCMSGDDG